MRELCISVRKHGKYVFFWRPSVGVFETLDDADHIARPEQPCVLPAGFVGRRRLTVDAENLKLSIMHVEGVRKDPSCVPSFPVRVRLAKSRWVPRGTRSSIRFIFIVFPLIVSRPLSRREHHRGHLYRALKKPAVGGDLQDELLIFQPNYQDR